MPPVLHGVVRQTEGGKRWSRYDKDLAPETGN